MGKQKVTGNKLIRRKSKTDDYQTPEWAVDALLEVETFPGFILEPAAGQGNIYRALKRYGYKKVYAADIRTDDELPEFVHKGVSFFGQHDHHRFVDHVITNPPYRIAQAFANRGLQVATAKVALLLRVNFVEGEKRYDWFQETPLKGFYPFSSRLTMWPRCAEEPENSGTIAYAWYVWEHGWTGDPFVRWLKPCKNKFFSSETNWPTGSPF